MRVLIQPNYDAVSKWAADYVANAINAFNPTEDKKFVLGLPTGSSPLGMYKELTALNKAGKVSFKHVVTFNMDEYVDLPKEHPESYYSFMHTNLFNHIDIKEENVHLPSSLGKDLEANCKQYSDALNAATVDMQLLGIGANGHIGFNEPAEVFKYGTHCGQDLKAVNPVRLLFR